MKLYKVCTIADYNGHKRVAFDWFYHGKRNRRRQYAKLVRNYEDGDRYQESAIDQLFTSHEAKKLKDYLDRVHGNDSETAIEQVNLPIGSNIIGVGSLAVGGPTDFYALSREAQYDLPFSVMGYFDLRNCDPVNPARDAWLDDLVAHASLLADVARKERTGERDGYGRWKGSDAFTGTLDTMETLLKRRLDAPDEYTRTDQGFGLKIGTVAQFGQVASGDDIPF